MNLSDFKDALDKHAEKDLSIVIPGGHSVPAHFHITEVGRTEKRFVDCGGKVRNLAFASVQVWVANDTSHRLSARKLASILEKTESIIGFDNPEMQVEYQEGSIALLSVEGFEVMDGSIAFLLANKQTACLAMEACLSDPNDGEESCCDSSSTCCR